MVSILRRTSEEPTERDLSHVHRPVRIWLLLAACLVLLTLSIGGMTRLTSSGLSITEWDPVMGVVPPLTPQDWMEQFEKYKTTYEYSHVNMNMTLDEFRYIYNWEWRHRLVARLVFLAVFLPFIYFVLAGKLSRGMQQRVLVVLGLIVLQGFIGWLMVQSGLRSDVKVSPYRLALHLGMASLLFAMLMAMAFGQDDRPVPSRIQGLARSRLFGRVLIGLVFALILFGALVAGLRGGRTHDTWPLMEGSLIPGNLFVLSPWITNFFENPLTAQWVHRLLAYLLIAGAVLHWRGTVRRDEPEAVINSALWILVGVCVQAVIGIVTVLNQVPLPLGLLHQLWAFGLLSLAIWHLYEIERYAVSPQGSSRLGEGDAVASPQSAGAAITQSRQRGPSAPASSVVGTGTILTRASHAGRSSFPAIGAGSQNRELTREQPVSGDVASPVDRPSASPVPFRRPTLDS